MNDNDRAQWVENHEGLYHWWLGTKRRFGNGSYGRVSLREFVRSNRAEIDETVNALLGR
jgi:hypothetical protein